MLFLMVLFSNLLILQFVYIEASLQLLIQTQNNSDEILRCVAKGITVNSALYWIDENYKLIRSYSHIYPKPKYLIKKYIPYDKDIREQHILKDEGLSFTECLKNLIEINARINDEVRTIFITKSGYFFKSEENIPEETGLDDKGTCVWRNVLIKPINKSLIINIDQINFAIPFQETQKNMRLDVTVNDLEIIQSNLILGEEIYNHIAGEYNFNIKQPEGLCISMLLSLCYNCIINIEILIDNQTRKTYLIKSEGKEWQNVQLKDEKIAVKSKIKIKFTGPGKGNITWNVDEIRTCTTSEILVSVIKNTSSLKIIGCVSRTENIKAVKTVGSDPDMLDKQDDLFKDCQLIFKNNDMCEKQLICSETGCNCSPGYEGIGCQERCPNRKWGLLCKNICGDCISKSICNHVTGVCEKGCMEGYERPMCLTPEIVVEKNKLSMVPPATPVNIKVIRPAKEVKVYSCNQTTLFIKWNFDYFQEKRNVKLQYYNERNSFEIPMSRTNHCKLWKGNYTCDEITNLKPNTNYTLTLSYVTNTTKTEEVLYGVTTESKPSPPLNLKNVCQSDHKLCLEWDHPDKTNGKIRYFHVDLNNSKIPTLVPAATESRHYAKEFTANYSTIYNVSICAGHADLGSSAFGTFYTAPPSPESLTPPVLKCDETSCSLTIFKAKIPYENRQLEIFGTEKNVLPKVKSGISNITIIPNDTFFYKKIELGNTAINISIKFEEITKMKGSFRNMIEEGKTIFLIVLKNYFKQLENRFCYEVFLQKNQDKNVLLIILSIITFITIMIASIIGFFYLLRKKKCICLEKKLTELMSPHRNVQIEEMPLLIITSADIKLEDFKLYMKKCLIEFSIDEYNIYNENNILYEQFEETKEITRIETIEYDYANALEFSIVESENKREYMAVKHDYCASVAANHRFWNIVWNSKITTIINIENSVSNKLFIPEVSTLNREVLSITDAPEYHYAYGCNNYHKLALNLNKNNENIRTNIMYLHRSDPLYPEKLAPIIESLSRNREEKILIIDSSQNMDLAGIIIICDMAFQKFSQNGVCNFQEILKKVLIEGKRLIQINKEFYVLLHQVLLECMFAREFEILLDDDFENKIQIALTTDTVTSMKDFLELVTYKKDFQINNYTFRQSYRDSVVRSVYSLTQNSFISNMITYLKDLPGCAKKFLVTPEPTLNTVKDFWKFVYSENANLVLSLNDTDAFENAPVEALDDCEYETVWEQPFEITYSNKTEFAHFFERSVSIKKEESYNGLYNNQINLLQVKNWPRETNCPSTEKLLSLVKKISTEKSGTIVVVCFDGITAGGLFIALYNILEEINTKRVCNIYKNVRNMRRKRQYFLQTEEQLEFLHKAVLESTKLYDSCVYK